MIGGPYRVFSWIEGCDTDNIQGDEPKIKIGLETWPHRDGLAVEEPLDAHCRVTHRLQTALQMNVFALRHGARVAQRNHENRPGFGDLLDVVLGLLSPVENVINDKVSYKVMDCCSWATLTTNLDSSIRWALS